MRTEALKGHVGLLLLTVMEDGPRQGYAVIEELRQRTGDALDLPEGTVYPALHRLEKAGLLASTWGDVGGRRRRTYQLTATGKGAVKEKRRDWQAFAAAVQGVLANGAGRKAGPCPTAA